MFDIGFSELLLIGVVALLVIGPERLPKVARTAGHLFGRFQRYVSNVKEDIGREMQLEELQKAGQTFKQSVEQAVHGVERNAEEVEFTMRDEVVKPIEEAAKAVEQPDLFEDAAKQPETTRQLEASAAEPENHKADTPEAKA